ncbi:MAG: hypothetical protein ACHP7E_08905, partial [Burkholderiales bacterium]
MSDERVRVRMDDHGVAEVALVRADKMNALDGPMFRALVDAPRVLLAEAHEQQRLLGSPNQREAVAAGME